jgi:hypothetical protein
VDEAAELAFRLRVMVLRMEVHGGWMSVGAATAELHAIDAEYGSDLSQRYYAHSTGKIVELAEMSIKPQVWSPDGV